MELLTEIPPYPCPVTTIQRQGCRGNRELHTNVRLKVGLGAHYGLGGLDSQRLTRLIQDIGWAAQANPGVWNGSEWVGCSCLRRLGWCIGYGTRMKQRKPLDWQWKLYNPGQSCRLGRVHTGLTSLGWWLTRPGWWKWSTQDSITKTSIIVCLNFTRELILTLLNWLRFLFIFSLNYSDPLIMFMIAVLNSVFWGSSR